MPNIERVIKGHQIIRLKHTEINGNLWCDGKNKIEGGFIPFVRDY